jgi:hypothetical protein
MSDWNDIDPILVEEEIKFEQHFDIQYGYITADETHLFIRIDYAGSPPADISFLFSNVTIRTPNEQCFVLSITVDFEYDPITTFVTEGIDILSPYHPSSGEFYTNEYYNNAAYDESTKSSTECAFPLADFGLTFSDSIDVSFWHIDDQLAGTVYDVNLDRSEPQELDLGYLDSNLFFSRFVGGSEEDKGTDIAFDNLGNVILVGSTKSSDFPSNNSFNGGETDVFVTKLDPKGNMIWSQYLGGSAKEGSTFENCYIRCDIGEANNADLSNWIIIAGTTYSSDFPLRFAIDNQFGGSEIFVTNLSNSNGEIAWSTYIGGSYLDEAYDVAIDRTGRIVVVGKTTSFNFPKRTYPNTTYEEDGHCCIIKMHPNGSLAWTSRLGLVDSFYEDVEIDLNNEITVSGQSSNNYFIRHFSSQGELLWEQDYFYNIAPDGMIVEDGDIEIDSQGNIFITGTIQVEGFSTSGSAFSSYNGGWSDGFITKLSPNGSLVWSTYLGGSDEDNCFGLAIDKHDNILVTGFTFSGDFPFEGFEYKFFDYNCFLTKFDNDGSVIWSGCIGGFAIEYGKAVTFDEHGNFVVTGHTQSENYPVTLEGNYIGGTQTNGVYERDVFVSYFNLSWILTPSENSDSKNQSSSFIPTLYYFTPGYQFYTIVIMLCLITLKRYNYTKKT